MHQLERAYRGIREACPPDLLSISCMVRVSWRLYVVAFQDFWTEFIWSTNPMLFVYGSFMSLEIKCLSSYNSINAITHSRLMKSHEISSRYREQWKDYRVRREKQKLLTLTVCVGIQAWDCGRFGVGWAAPSSQWNSPSYSPKHHEPNRGSVWSQ